MTPAAFIAARNALGLTQAQMAEALGRHRVTVARYESGDLEIPRVVEMAVKAMEMEG